MRSQLTPDLTTDLTADLTDRTSIYKAELVPDQSHCLCCRYRNSVLPSHTGQPPQGVGGPHPEAGGGHPGLQDEEEPEGGGRGEHGRRQPAHGLVALLHNGVGGDTRDHSSETLGHIVRCCYHYHSILYP